MSIKNRAQGYTLVEIMVSLTICIILSAGAIQILFSSSSSSRVSQQLATMQETARFAASKLAEEVRMAGYLGCADASSSGLSVVEVKPGVQQSLDFNGFLVAPNAGGQRITPMIFGKTVLSDAFLLGVDGNAIEPLTNLENWTQNTPIDIAPVVGKTIAENSDVLIIQRAHRTAGRVLAVNGSTVSTTDSPVTTGNIGLITDCTGIDMFYVSNFNNNDITLDTADNTRIELQQFQIPANPLTGPHLHRFGGFAYYVGYLNDDPSEVPVLYQANLYDPAGGKIELVRGVENMQVEYGISTDQGNSILYVNADTLLAMASPVVATVRLAILVRSEAPLAHTHTPQTYRLLNEVIQTDDQFIRSVFTTTIKVRNRRII